MSWLSKLNPFTWLKDLLVSDYVGGQLRHWLGIIGAYVVASYGAPQSFAELLVSPEFVGGVVAIVTAIVSSVANKKVS